MLGIIKILLVNFAKISKVQTNLLYIYAMHNNKYFRKCAIQIKHQSIKHIL